MNSYCSSVCIMPPRSLRRRHTIWTMSTMLSLSICLMPMARARKQPVRPMPALQWTRTAPEPDDDDDVDDDDDDERFVSVDVEPVWFSVSLKLKLLKLLMALMFVLIDDERHFSTCLISWISEFGSSGTLWSGHAKYQKWITTLTSLLCLKK